MAAPGEKPYILSPDRVTTTDGQLVLLPDAEDLETAISQEARSKPCECIYYEPEMECCKIQKVYAGPLWEKVSHPSARPGWRLECPECGHRDLRIGTARGEDRRPKCKLLGDPGEVEKRPELSPAVPPWVHHTCSGRCSSRHGQRSYGGSSTF